MISNGWDDATSALQLLLHLEGDALIVALLVPATRGTSRVGLVDALMAHYGSPGRLADYRRQFQKITQVAGTDPAIFAFELETLPMKAFGDMGHMARLRLVRDRFIAGQDRCTLSRHLTVCRRRLLYRILLIGAGCGRVMLIWRTKGGGTPARRSLPMYAINDGGMQGMTYLGRGDDITPEAQELLESLLPTPVVSPPKVTPIPSELDLLIQRLIGNDRPVQPAPTGRSSFSSFFSFMEVLIQKLLPVRPSTLEQPPREPGRWDWSSVVCFLCGKPGHAASWCPALDVTFPFLLPGWRGEKMGGGFVMQSPRMLAEGLRTENGD